MSLQGLDLTGKHDEENRKNLRHFIGTTAEFWIKFNNYVRIDLPEYDYQTLVSAVSGAVMIGSLKKSSQRFYSNLAMTECDADFMDPHLKRNRITRIRDLIFIGSQLYVKTLGEGVLKMRDDDGFMSLKVSNIEFKSIIKQLRDPSHS